MEKKISYMGENSMYDFLLKEINEERITELNQARKNYEHGELEEVIDEVESTYDFNMSKLESLEGLNEKDLSIRTKFVETMLYIEGTNLPVDVKLRLVLTLGVVLDKFTDHVEFYTDEELFLISGAMIRIPIESYEIYEKVVSNGQVIKSVMHKTNDLNNRMDIYNKVLNYCDYFVEPDMDELKYNSSINDCLTIIENYKVNEKSAKTI